VSEDEPELRGSTTGRRELRRRVADTRERTAQLRREAEVRLESERARRGWLRIAYEAWDLDRRRGGPLLAGGLAYRIFLWQLPASLLLVSLLGFVADDRGRSPVELARQAGLSAAVAGLVADAAAQADEARWWLLVVGAVLTVWAGRGGARAATLTSRIAWALPPPSRPGSAIRASLAFSAVLLLGIAIQALAPALFGGGLAEDAGAWLMISAATLGLVLGVMHRLPRRPVGWLGLLPGALFVTAALRGLSVATGVYFAGRLDRVDDLYGGLGVAIVILLYLYLAARSFVWGQFLNARIAGVSLDEGGSVAAAIAATGTDDDLPLR
jgi:uncharacterized BrkB/YihY/UPF0761 family membrane protein